MIRSRRVLARCPQCHGRLFFQNDKHGAYLGCIACGCVLEERTEADERELVGAPAAWWRAQPA